MLFQIIDCFKAFGSQELFQNLSFQIKGKEKTAIVGKNGIGKTTLLDIIAGIEDMDSGELIKDKDCKVGYLKQTVFQSDDITAEEEFEKCFESIHSCESRLKEIELQMQTEYSEEILERYGRLQQRYEEMGGYDYQTEIKTIFTKFGFQIDELQKKIGEFSGGEKTKLAFVKLLLSKPDILLLDEPTNHLDLETIEWLEGYIKNYPKAVVVVSHDRMFLDNTVGVVYELEWGAACRYAGNYTAFIAEKKNNIARQNQLREIQQKEIRHLEALIERFRYKVNKAKFAQSKIKYLERMDVISERKEETSNINVSFSSRRKGAEKALTVRNLKIGYSQPLFTLSFNLLNGGCTAVIGKNGSGKSTLAKTLTGRVKPLGGSYRFGERIDIGYFDQELAQFCGSRCLLEEIWDSFPNLGQSEIRNALGRLNFRGDEVFKELDVLSGGEKVRLAFVKLMLRHDNFLILDEPTNHLDIYGKEALEKSLKEFDGTILLISHDRYFVSKIATSIIEVGSSGAVFYDMPYNEYLLKRNQ